MTTLLQSDCQLTEALYHIPYNVTRDAWEGAVMTELQIAYLELAIVGGLGALLVIAGIVARALAKRANDSCTARTTGTVLKHRFAGEGRLYPVVQYEVNGKNHQVRKRYNGVKLVRVTGLPVPMQRKYAKTRRAGCT